MNYKIVRLPQYADIKAWIDIIRRTIYINESARETAKLYQIIR